MDETEEYIDEEVFFIERSGEMPEVAYHSSLFFLTRDEDGPGVSLSDKQLLPMKKAVISQYADIMRRDLNPENRDKRIYRGLERCVANWERLNTFCARAGLSADFLKEEMATRLRAFLDNEVKECSSGQRHSSINCNSSRLKKFAGELGLKTSDLPPGWQQLCPQS